MFALSIAAALAAAQPATAAPDASPVEEDIVVTGELPETEHEKIKSVVRALADEPTKGQIARFHRPICPFIVGLPKPQADALIARMRRVASAVGIGEADAQCDANLMLVIAEDRDAVFKELRRDHRKIFWGMEPADIRRIQRTEGPVAAWQVVVQADRDLDALPVDSLNGYTVNESMQDPSRIRSTSRPDTRAAVVVIDANAATGLSVEQLADHAMMRAMVKMDKADVGRLSTPSILHLFTDLEETGEAPASLTQYDAAFLEALYSTSNVYFAYKQRADMREAMTQALSEYYDEAGVEPEVEAETPAE